MTEHALGRGLYIGNSVALEGAVMSDRNWQQMDDMSSSAQATRRLQQQLDELRVLLGRRPRLSGVPDFDTVMATVEEELVNVSSAIEREDPGGAKPSLDILIGKVSGLKSALNTAGVNMADLADLTAASGFVEELLERLRTMEAAARS